MKNEMKIMVLLIAITSFILFTGCGLDREREQVSMKQKDIEEITKTQNFIIPTAEIIPLEEGLSTVRYEGDYGFDNYLNKGGASSDLEVVQFLVSHLLFEGADIAFQGDTFGCSTLSVESTQGDRLFGRNFDWNHCEAMIVYAKPDNGYASLSTVNMDFITMGNNSFKKLSDKMRTIAALYAPLDGMNEEGLCVAVNMIQDSAAINQQTDKADITTTTAIRLLLDKAANVGEALDLLKQYDMHASMGMIVHFALADKEGKSVAVEYVDNKMTVTETPVVTNFYFAPGEKNGVGTAQSYTRYEKLVNLLEENTAMDMKAVKDALDSVSKHNFGEFESTEWSIVFNQNNGEVHYYHRENYNKSYKFSLE